MSMKTDGVFQFGEFQIDARARTLRRAEEIVTLNFRAFDVLLYLVQNPGKVLTRNELLENVWQDAHVDENNLAQSISALRRALEEGPQIFIGHGSRPFSGPVGKRLAMGFFRVQDQFASPGPPAVQVFHQPLESFRLEIVPFRRNFAGAFADHLAGNFMFEPSSQGSKASMPRTDSYTRCRA